MELETKHIGPAMRWNFRKSLSYILVDIITTLYNCTSVIMELQSDGNKADQDAKVGQGRLKPVGAPKLKITPSVKRISSAGLQVDSVLRTKTGHLWKNLKATYSKTHVK